MLFDSSLLLILTAKNKRILLLLLYLFVGDFSVKIIQMPEVCGKIAYVYTLMMSSKICYVLDYRFKVVLNIIEQLVNLPQIPEIHFFWKYRQQR